MEWGYAQQTSEFCKTGHITYGSDPLYEPSFTEMPSRAICITDVAYSG